MSNAPSTTLDSLGEETFRAWLAREPSTALVDQWITWNNAPLCHVPPATLTSFFPESFYHTVQEDPRVSAYVNALLRSQFLWKEPVTWAPHDPLWEIGMLAPNRFERLALLGSALSMHQEITQIIDGSIVRKLRQQLGEDSVQFVLLSGSSSKYLLEGVHTELAALNDPVGAIKQGAITIIEHAFSSRERGIQQRIASKLPGCFAKALCGTPLPWAPQAEKILSELWKETSSWI